MCQEYAAVGSSISGIYAADQGNMTSAIEHLKLASSLGHAPAYFNLGLCFEMGCGVSKDMEKVLPLDFKVMNQCSVLVSDYVTVSVEHCIVSLWVFWHLSTGLVVESFLRMLWFTLHHMNTQ